MILAAHPPAYLPSPVFFRKMLLADVFVLADTLPYSRHGEFNRCRIRTARGPTWLTVPAYSRGRREQRLCDVEIRADSGWRRKHQRALQLNYGYAPYFDKYRDFFEAMYARDWRRLCELNLHAIGYLCEVLGVRARVLLLSGLGLAERGWRLLLELANRTGCQEYLAEPRFRSYLDSGQIERHGLRLRFVDESTPPYHQPFGAFAPGLSIIDLLFNEGEEAGTILLSRGASA